MESPFVVNILKRFAMKHGDSSAFAMIFKFHLIEAVEVSRPINKTISGEPPFGSWAKKSPCLT